MSAGVFDEIFQRMQMKGSKNLLSALNRLDRLLNKKAIKSVDPEVMALLADFSVFLTSKNAKVVHLALNCLSRLALIVGDGLSAFLKAILPLVIERLGDLKEPVRQEAKEVLLSFIKALGGPDDIMMHFPNPLSTHKSPLVRLGLVRCISSSCSSIDRKLADVLVPHVACLLGDQSPDVRNAALKCMAKLYARFGDRLKSSLKHVQLSSKSKIALKELFAVASSSRGSSREKLQISKYPSGSSKSSRPSSQKSQKSQKSTGRRSAKSSKSGKSGKGRGAKVFTFENTSPVKVTDNANGYEAKSRAVYVAVPEGVQEVRIYSEKELEKEMLGIFDTLTDIKKNGWKQRINSLSRLAGVVMGGAHDFDNFQPLLKKLKQSLIEQLKDLRSSVVKRACSVLAYMSSIMRDTMEVLMEFLIPVLSKLNCVTIQVISESANDCMQALLTHTRCPRRAIQKILDMANDKAPPVREKSLGYLTILLHDGPTDMTKRLSVVETLLKTRLVDASAPVRQSARRAFRALAARWPSRADELSQELDPKTQRLIENENDMPPPEPVQKFVPPERRATPSPRESGHASTKSASSSAKRRNRTKSAVEAAVQAAVAEAAASTAAVAEAAASTAAVEHSKSPPRREITAAATAGGKRANPSAFGRLGGAKRAPIRAEKGGDNNGGNKNSQHSAEGSHYHPSRTPLRLGGAARISHEAQQQAAKHNQDNNANKQQAAAATGDGSKVSGSHMHEKHASSHSLKVTTSKKHHHQQQPHGHHDRKSKSTSNMLEPSPRNNHSHHSEPTLAHLINAAHQCYDWQDKVESLRKLASALSTTKSIPTAHQHAARLVNLYEQRLPDGHQKVATSALAGLPALAKFLGADLLQPYMSRLLIKLLPRVQDHKLAVRKAAQAALGNLIEQLGSGVLRAIIRASTSKSPQVRTAAMTALVSLVDSFPGFFGNHHSSFTSTATSVTRCLSEMRPGANPLRKPAAKLLEVLYTRFSSAFVSFVMAATTHDQNVIIAALRRVDPDIERNLTAAVRPAAVRPGPGPAPTSAAEGDQNRPVETQTNGHAIADEADAADADADAAADVGGRGDGTLDIEHQPLITQHQPLTEQRQPLTLTDEIKTHTATIVAVPDTDTDTVPVKRRNSNIFRAQGGVTAKELVLRLHSSDRQLKLETLEMMGWIARQRSSLWDVSFDELSLGLLEELYDTRDPPVITAILTLLGRIFPLFPSRFKEFSSSELLILSILETLRDHARHLQPNLRLVEQAMDFLALAFEPVKVFGIYVALIDAEVEAGSSSSASSSEEAAPKNASDAGPAKTVKQHNKTSSGTQRGLLIARLGLKALATLIKRIQPEVLMERLDRISPTLVKCLNHKSVVVRKSVVQCFVEIHALVGAEVLAKSSDLTDSQQRLIKIYVQKSAGKATAFDRNKSSNKADSKLSKPRRSPLRPPNATYQPDKYDDATAAAKEIVNENNIATGPKENRQIRHPTPLR